MNHNLQNPQYSFGGFSPKASILDEIPIDINVCNASSYSSFNKRDVQWISSKFRGQYVAGRMKDGRYFIWEIKKYRVSIADSVTELQSSFDFGDDILEGCGLI